jgi:deazaflavin-dependent oxidoreductase (nitroreductase family)
VLLLTTTGRRTGRNRTTPLLYERVDADRLLLAAANGAADWRPAWLLNLTAHACVTVEMGVERWRGEARILPPEERAGRWRGAVAAFPGLDAAQRATTRAIDLVEVRLVDRVDS